MAKGTCSIDECDKSTFARGWCQKHYGRWHRHGNPLKNPARKYPNTEASFAAQTEWKGDCLIWTGPVNSSGYGALRDGNVRTSPHRYAWEVANGPIPKGMVVDHTFHCSRRCCNARHLRLATRGQNYSNRSGPTRGNKSSGIRNVKAHHNKWLVRVQKDGKGYYFGLYSTIEEAAKVAERARKEMFGEFAGRG